MNACGAIINGTVRNGLNIEFDLQGLLIRQQRQEQWVRRGRAKARHELAVVCGSNVRALGLYAPGSAHVASDPA